MKKLSRSLLKLFLVLASVVGILSFTRSLAPQRSQAQKVYDDFVKELNQEISLTTTRTSDTNPDIVAHPPVTIEFSIKEADQIKLYKHALQWDDSSNVKKTLRVLDLLQLANVFSQTSGGNTENADISIKVIAASGYKFESFLKAKELNTNSPLGLAIVLMRELSDGNK